MISQDLQKTGKTLPTNINDVCAQASDLSAGAPTPQNAFTLAGPPIRIRATHISKAAATRVNKNVCAVAWCGSTNSERAPR